MASSRFLSSASSLRKLLRPNLPFTLRTLRASSSASALLKLHHSNLSPTAATPSAIRTFRTTAPRPPTRSIFDENPPILRLYFPIENGLPMWYVVDGDDESVIIRFDMPGVEKEGLKIWVEEGSMWLDAVETAPLGKNNTPRYFKAKLEMDGNLYRAQDIKAKLKDGGVLKLVIPKVRNPEIKK